MKLCKKNLFAVTLLSIVLFISILMFGLSLSPNTVKAQPYSTFEMVGAGVKVNFNQEGSIEGVNNALRFTTRIAQSEITDENADSVSVITLFARTDKLINAEIGADNFTEADLTNASIAYGKVAFSEAYGNLRAVAKDGYYLFNACVYNITEENFDTAISAISYITIGGETYSTGYTEKDNSRSISQVAQIHLDNYPNLENEDPDEYAYVCTLLTSYKVAVTGFDGEVVTINVKSGETLATHADLLANELKVDGAAYYNGTLTNGEKTVDLSVPVTEPMTLVAGMKSLSFTEVAGGYAVSKGTLTQNETYTFKIPATYNGQAVIAVSANGFAESTGIEKMLFPESVVSIGGSAFSQCYAVKYIALPGLEVIKAELHGVNQFLWCMNLKTLILGKSFITDTQTFAKEPNTTVGIDVYLSSADGTFSATAGDNKLLSGNVYHYDKDGACGTWKYNEDKTNVVLTAHEYEDGLCTNCGALQTEGVVYTPSGDNYVVTGYTGSASEVYIAAKIDNKPVVAIGKSAFGGKAITKLVAPASVASVGADAFSQCYALTYVALPGWTNSNNNGGAIENENHYNQFYACGKLETLIVGESFTTIHQTFVPESGQGQVIKVYLSSSDGTFVRTGPDNLLTDVKYYYSESQPTDTEKTYWHYDEKGNAVLWTVA